MSKVPEIRFDGFCEDWKQRKLGDEAIEMLAGGDIDKSRVVENGKYPIYANALTNDGIVGYYDDYYRVKAPAVTVTGRGDVGHAQARTVDFTPVVRLLAIRSEHDAYFLENAINKHGVIVESTGVPQLTVPQLGNYIIQFPRTIEEETKIGDYFRNLDNLITLHQRKLQTLVNFKASMLDKMFPKEGKTVPEIRFAGFNDDWEQRKVSDIANRYDNLRIPVAANLRIPGVTPYYGANGIQDYVDGFTHEGEFVLVAEDGANDLKNYPVKCVNGRIWVNNHAHVLQSKPEMADNKFLAYSISQADIEALLVGGGRSKLNAEVMMSIELVMPSLPEQISIGRCMTRLDHLITLHQRKLEKLQNFKAAMLDKMFSTEAD